MLVAFTNTLANALSVKCQERLDKESVARQTQRVAAVRKAMSRDASHEFYSRQDLMQKVHRWLDAQHVRGYLQDLRTAIAADKLQPVDAERFEEWFNWASRFANFIDPIVQGPLPEGNAMSHQNIAISELDLTAAARRVVDCLGVADTDSLWTTSQEAVRDACDGRFGPVWNEISRVLEGLGYDVSKRQVAQAWW